MTILQYLYINIFKDVLIFGSTIKLHTQEENLRNS